MFKPTALNAKGGGGPFGAGIVIGAPTGFTGKYFLNPEGAIDFGLAFYFSNLILFYGDYLWHFPGAFGRSSQFVSQLTPYVGVGAVMLLWTAYGVRHYYDHATAGMGLGMRIPLGIEWRPSHPPLGVFIELAPGIGIVPGTFGFFQGGIGIRYYF